MKSRGINKSRRSKESTGAIRVTAFARNVRDSRRHFIFLRVSSLDL
jgi:hypothetical protein